MKVEMEDIQWIPMPFPKTTFMEEFRIWHDYLLASLWSPEKARITLLQRLKELDLRTKE